MEGVGLIRALKFAKYLPEYGWEPVILTVKYDAVTPGTGDLSFNGKVYRTEYKVALAGARSIIRRSILVPDEQIGWYSFAVDAGRRLMETEGIDLIFSTSPVSYTHLTLPTILRV